MGFGGGPGGGGGLGGPGFAGLQVCGGWGRFFWLREAGAELEFWRVGCKTGSLGFRVSGFRVLSLGFIIFGVLGFRDRRCGCGSMPEDRKRNCIIRHSRFNRPKTYRPLSVFDICTNWGIVL